MAHKSPRAEGSIFSPLEFHHASPGASRVDLHGQHVGGIVHKPPVHSEAFCRQAASLAVSRSPSALHSSSARSGSPEQRRKYAFERWDSSQRMETEPQESKANLGRVWKNGGRPVRDGGEHSVLLPVTISPRRGRTHDAMAKCPYVCVPPR